MNPLIIISACLAGLRTRYDGKAKPHPQLREIAGRAVLVPICPEILGGLGIPRSPCHFVGGDGAALLRKEARVIDKDGIDRTSCFLRAADECMRIVELVSPGMIIFKEGSPSCGVHRVDIEGSWQSGCGVVTATIRDLNIAMISEEDSLPDLSTLGARKSHRRKKHGRRK
jgi:uncharacterized protein YbbK (DUF523 family)